MLRNAIIYGGGYMKSFAYVAQDAKNKQVKGVINAENEQDFLKRIKEKACT